MIGFVEKFLSGPDGRQTDTDMVVLFRVNSGLPSFRGPSNATQMFYFDFFHLCLSSHTVYRFSTIWLD